MKGGEDLVGKKLRTFYLSNECMEEMAAIQEHLENRMLKEVGYKQEVSQSKVIEMAISTLYETIRKD